MLELREIAYSYRQDKTPAIYRYDMGLHGGRIAGILGPSGSGKSTMLDLIAGFLMPDSGDILLEGQSILGLPPQKRPVNILFQKNNLFEHLSVIQNVIIGIRGRISGTPQEIKKAEAILRQMDISDYRDKPVTQLSGGEQQRVALARALIRRKPILLLDEPFTGLDSETKDGILQIVRDITTEIGLHTVMVTHDRNDCNKIADSIYQMKDNKLIALSPAEAEESN